MYPDLFITITLNEEDEDILVKIRDGGAKLSTDDPVTLTEYFFKKQKRINKGKVTSCFQRIEYQDRGAPHSHILLYLNKEGTARLGNGVAISAMIPNREDDPELYHLVYQYQIHNVNNSNCSLYTHPLYLCFPQHNVKMLNNVIKYKNCTFKLLAIL